MSDRGTNYMARSAHRAKVEAARKLLEASAELHPSQKSDATYWFEQYDKLATLARQIAEWCEHEPSTAAESLIATKIRMALRGEFDD